MSSIFDGFPNPMRISAFDVPIDISPTLSERKGDEAWGEFDDHTYTITFAQNQISPTHATDVAYHELLHVIWKTGNIEQGDSEERIISTLATGLAQVTRDNPAFVNWLYRMIQPSK